MKIRIKLIAALAASLALCMTFSACVNSSASVVVKANYPEQAKYPGSEILPGFEGRYKEWNEGRRAQRENFGAGETLDGFFKETVSEFLSGNEDNTVYSPLNVYMALAMLAETAGGESREQILSLLGAGDIEELRDQAKKVWLANYSDDGAVTSILGSSLWLSEHMDYNAKTLDTLANNYFASAYSGKMGSASLNTELKNWLNEQTGGLLKDYIDGIELTPETVMALYTTIYFQAKWDNEFSSGNNDKRVFHAASGDKTLEFMNCTETYGVYCFGDKFGATEKRLKNSGSMWFILPDEGVSVDELLADDEALSFIVSNGDFENQKTLRVNLSVPKFDVKSKIDLSAGLKKLGVTNCFDAAKADFSPLISGNAWLDKVNHGARVKIDEEGVTAAAYTEMLLCGAAMPPEDEIDFVLDRPFVFVITGSDGLPLFVGTVKNP